MDRFEINKIIAAIILTVVAILGIDKLADIIYKTKTPNLAIYKVKVETSQNSNETKIEGSSV